MPTELPPRMQPSSLSDPVAGSRPRRGISRVTVLLLIGLLGVAGVATYLSLPELDEKAMAEAARPVPPDRPKPKRVEPPAEGDEFRSRLAVLRVGTGDAARSVVALAFPRGPQRVEQLTGSDQSLIGRDLLRQALLIAARDEMGLTTRDELLDGLPLENGEVTGIEVASVLRPGGGRAIIRRVDDKGNATESLLRHDLSGFKDDAGMLPAIVPHAEALSRSEFPKILKALGLTGEPNKIRPEAPLAADIEERLTHLGFTENFSAIRDLHAALRTDGESPARSGALARGYAQLGVLSEFHWHPAHKAFKARALLYAQRMVARDPKSADALRTRAFVRAVIGMPWAALDDLAEATKLADATKPATPPPAWLKVIESFARTDLKALKSVDGPYARLAAMLRMFALEYPVGSLATHAAYDTIRADADCYRAYDQISHDQGISILHMSTLAAPAQLAWTLPTKLKALKGLPPGAQAPLDRLEKTLATLRALRDAQEKTPQGEGAEAEAKPEVEAEVEPKPESEPKPDGKDKAPDPIADEVALVDALADGGKPGADLAEPGWGVLAQLIRETNFMQVWRRLDFMKNRWAVPLDDYWAAARPLVAHHRYLPFLELKADPGPESRVAFAAFAKHADVSSFELGQSELVNEVVRESGTNGHAIWSIVYFHGDSLVRDISKGAWAGNQKQALQYAKTLLELDPRSAHAMSRLIKLDWDNAKDKVDAWRKTTDESPILLQALALKYTELKQYDVARRVLEDYIRESPEPWAYETLAANFQAQGDFEKYRSTLKDSLESSSNERGLDHARIQVKLADDLMKQKKWAEARPYAEAAAETWAAWAMRCAARCAEGSEDWEAAETWYKRIVERYPTSCHTDWLDFCKRSGHGDLAAAKKWTEQFLAANQNNPQVVTPESLGYRLLIEGQPKKALEKFEEAFKTTRSPSAGTHLALVADQLGENARRDQALKEMTELKGTEAPKTKQLCRMFLDELSEPDKKPLDLVEVDKIIESIPPERRGMTEYVVGYYLSNRGRIELARQYLQRCADSATTHEIQKAISTNLLKSPALKPKS